MAAWTRVRGEGLDGELEGVVQECLVGGDEIGEPPPGRTWTAKISWTASSNRRNAAIWPVRMSTTQTPQVRSAGPLGDGDAAEDWRLSRTCDRPTKAKRPRKSSPRVKPGKCGDRLISARGRVDEAEAARPRFSTQSRPRTSAASGASTAVGDDLAAGHVDQDAAGSCGPPAGRRVGLAQGRDVARPAVEEAPSRSGGSGPPGRGPRRMAGASGATKLWSAVKRAEAGEAGVDEPELIIAPRPSRGSGCSPVTWQERGRKQASCRPAGSRRGRAVATSWNSQISDRVPRARRSPLSAGPSAS